MVIRSTSNSCGPPGPSTGPRRRRISVKAVGQSSSVPSRSPILCLVNAYLRVSAESRQVMGQLGAPGRPVVRDVIPPQIDFVLDPLVGEQRGKPPGTLQGARGVLPLALAADQQQADLAAQPVQ